MRNISREMKRKFATAKYTSALKVGAENCPGNFVRVYRLLCGQEILADQVRKTAFLEERDIGAFCKIGILKSLPIRMIQLKGGAIGDGNFSDFPRISRGLYI